MSSAFLSGGGGGGGGGGRGNTPPSLKRSRSHDSGTAAHCESPSARLRSSSPPPLFSCAALTAFSRPFVAAGGQLRRACLWTHGMTNATCCCQHSVIIARGGSKAAVSKFITDKCGTGTTIFFSSANDNREVLGVARVLSEAVPNVRCDFAVSKYFSVACATRNYEEFARHFHTIRLLPSDPSISKITAALEDMRLETRSVPLSSPTGAESSSSINSNGSISFLVPPIHSVHSPVVMMRSVSPFLRLDGGGLSPILASTGATVFHSVKALPLDRSPDTVNHRKQINATNDMCIALGHKLDALFGGVVLAYDAVYIITRKSGTTELGLEEACVLERIFQEWNVPKRGAVWELPVGKRAGKETVFKLLAAILEGFRISLEFKVRIYSRLALPPGILVTEFEDPTKADGGVPAVLPLWQTGCAEAQSVLPGSEQERVVLVLCPPLPGMVKLIEQVAVHTSADIPKSERRLRLRTQTYFSVAISTRNLATTFPGMLEFTSDSADGLKELKEARNALMDETAAWKKDASVISQDAVWQACVIENAHLSAAVTRLTAVTDPLPEMLAATANFLVHGCCEHPDATLPAEVCGAPIIWRELPPVALGVATRLASEKSGTGCPIVALFGVHVSDIMPALRAVAPESCTLALTECTLSAPGVRLGVSQAVALNMLWAKRCAQTSTDPARAKEWSDYWEGLWMALCFEVQAERVTEVIATIRRFTQATLERQSKVLRELKTVLGIGDNLKAALDLAKAAYAVTMSMTFNLPEHLSATTYPVVCDSTALVWSPSTPEEKCPVGVHLAPYAPKPHYDPRPWFRLRDAREWNIPGHTPSYWKVAGYTLNAMEYFSGDDKDYGINYSGGFIPEVAAAFSTQRAVDCTPIIARGSVGFDCFALRKATLRYVDPAQIGPHTLLYIEANEILGACIPFRQVHKAACLIKEEKERNAAINAAFRMQGDGIIILVRAIEQAVRLCAGYNSGVNPPITEGMILAEVRGTALWNHVATFLRDAELCVTVEEETGIHKTTLDAYVAPYSIRIDGSVMDRDTLDAAYTVEQGMCVRVNNLLAQVRDLGQELSGVWDEHPEVTGDVRTLISTVIPSQLPALWDKARLHDASTEEIRVLKSKRQELILTTLAALKGLVKEYRQLYSRLESVIIEIIKQLREGRPTIVVNYHRRHGYAATLAFAIWRVMYATKTLPGGVIDINSVMGAIMWGARQMYTEVRVSQCVVWHSTTSWSNDLVIEIPPAAYESIRAWVEEVIRRRTHELRNTQFVEEKKTIITKIEEAITVKAAVDTLADTKKTLDEISDGEQPLETRLKIALQVPGLGHLSEVPKDVTEPDVWIKRVLAGYWKVPLVSQDLSLESVDSNPRCPHGASFILHMAQVCITPEKVSEFLPNLPHLRGLELRASKARPSGAMWSALAAPWRAYADTPSVEELVWGSRPFLSLYGETVEGEEVVKEGETSSTVQKVADGSVEFIAVPFGCAPAICEETPDLGQEYLKKSIVDTAVAIENSSTVGAGSQDALSTALSIFYRNTVDRAAVLRQLMDTLSFQELSTR